MIECYEVQEGLKVLLESQGAPAMSVTAWTKAKAFPEEMLTRVGNLLAGIHRNEQALRGTAARAEVLLRACAPARGELQALGALEL